MAALLAEGLTDGHMETISKGSKITIGLAASAAAVLMCAVWWAGMIDTKVTAQGEDIREVKVELKSQGDKIDDIAEALNATDRPTAAKPNDHEL